MITACMGHSILITGAGTRVGKILAQGLADDGWSVAIHYNRSQKSADALVKEIRKQGGNASAVQANLNVPSELNSLIERAVAALGMPLTGLINNASTFSPDEVQTFTSAGYDHHLDVNLKAPLQLARDFAGQVPIDDQGVIINMLDQAVLNPSPDFFTYGVSKAALHAATVTLAQALAPKVRVCGIGPGPTLQSTHQTAKEFQRSVDRTPLKTGSPPEEILQAVRYLLSAKSVTGQMIAVDGGEHLIFQD